MTSIVNTTIRNQTGQGEGAPGICPRHRHRQCELGRNTETGGASDPPHQESLQVAKSPSLSLSQAAKPKRHRRDARSENNLHVFAAFGLALSENIVFRWLSWGCSGRPSADPGRQATQPPGRPVGRLADRLIGPRRAGQLGDRWLAGGVTG